jgi:uncharacterized protein (DUF302 family)
MNFAISRQVPGRIDDIEARIMDALKQVGFGILTRIEADKVIKEKLGLDIVPYRILGACNPQIAHAALDADPRIGVFLPCSVCLKQEEGDRVSIWALDPGTVVDAMANATLAPYGSEARALIEQAINAV